MLPYDNECSVPCKGICHTNLKNMITTFIITHKHVAAVIRAIAWHDNNSKYTPITKMKHSIHIQRHSTTNTALAICCSKF